MRDKRFHECSQEGCEVFGPYGHPDFKGGMRVTKYWCKVHRPTGEVVKLMPNPSSKVSTYRPLKKAAQGSLF